MDRTRSFDCHYEWPLWKRVAGVVLPLALSVVQRTAAVVLLLVCREGRGGELQSLHMQEPLAKVNYASKWPL